jgi:hypothetical protein
VIARREAELASHGAGTASCLRSGEAGGDGHALAPLGYSVGLPCSSTCGDDVMDLVPCEGAVSAEQISYGRDVVSMLHNQVPRQLAEWIERGFAGCSLVERR